jgi:phenylacetic acid degradation operon negative regulatory protein
MVQLLGEFGFSHGAARVALHRLVRRGLIERVRAGRLVHYRVTARADRLLAEGDGRIFALGHPSDSGQTWTLLWHQIPEDRRLERHRLARRLRFLGFGSVQDSVWISPHDHCQQVVELLEDLHVAESATLFSSSVVDVAGLPALVSRAWDLTGLAERYDSFCTEFAPYLEDRSVAGGREIVDLDAFLTRTKLMHHFRGFPMLDPELPDTLAPLSGPRARAVEIFDRLNEVLAEPSQRHFWSVAAGPAVRVPAAL